MPSALTWCRAATGVLRIHSLHSLYYYSSYKFISALDSYKNITFSKNGNPRGRSPLGRVEGQRPSWGLGRRPNKQSLQFSFVKLTLKKKFCLYGTELLKWILYFGFGKNFVQQSENVFVCCRFYCDIWLAARIKERSPLKVS